VVLLGDSIFDNQSYVEQDQAVIDHLRKWLGPTGSASLLAVDGSVVRDVNRQIVRVPRDATHVFLSAGGNDALGCMSVLNQPVSTVMEALGLLTERQTSFARDYLALAEKLDQLNLPVTVCTVYEDIPDLAAPLKSALSLFNDVIVRVAMRHQFGLLDLREHLQDATDYSVASPIEPSETGGDKIARALAGAVGVLT
jgi:GDSL-like Lipase/Acylhydrolase family